MILRRSKKGLEAGCDEAGRGCLAGPVFAAAVILPNNFPYQVLDDSKKLSPKKRIELRQLIEQKASFFAVAKCSHKEIDRYNILRASIRAMHKAIDKLNTSPNSLIIDGNTFDPYKKLRHTCIIGGDGTHAAIAAASILAKTYRDEFMVKLNKKYPMYGWDQNKGYPTKYHREAIQEFGHCPYHRITFKLYPDK